MSAVIVFLTPHHLVCSTPVLMPFHFSSPQAKIFLMYDMHYYFLQGAPSFVRLYEYPRLDPATIVASKSFYRADTVKFHWNKKGITTRYT